MTSFVSSCRADCESLKSEICKKLIHNLKLIHQFFISQNEGSIYVSFNGGKDCIATLLSIKFYLYAIKHGTEELNEHSFESFIKDCNSIKISEKIKFVYFSRKDSFEEEEDFVIKIAREEDVKLKIIYTDYRSGLTYLVTRGKLISIALGVRKDDYKQVDDTENCILSDIVQVSDHNYPPFYRLFPIYNFSYYEIWGLILLCKFKYPSLYDEGYSSFGRKSNSFKNPGLLDSVTNTYCPAYCLKCKKSERDFRK